MVETDAKHWEVFTCSGGCGYLTDCGLCEDLKDAIRGQHKPLILRPYLVPAAYLWVCNETIWPVGQVTKGS